MNPSEMKWKPLHLILIVLAMIVVLPPLLTNPWLCIIDFNQKGQVGDTIGGITAPFINGLSAILVYLAFKAQVDANTLIKQQDESRAILEQIRSLQESADDFDVVIHSIPPRREEFNHRSNPELVFMLDGMVFTLNEIRFAYEMINQFSGNKKQYLQKLNLLYRAKFLGNINWFETNLQISGDGGDYKLKLAEIYTTTKEIGDQFRNADSIISKR